MTFKITVSTVMEADILVEAETEEEAREKVDEGIYADSYCNNTAGFEVKSWADENLQIEEVYTYYDFDIVNVEEQ